MKKWEISRVSTFERVSDKINNRITWPIGIILFGADCKSKEEVLDDLLQNLQDVTVFPCAPCTQKMIELIHNGRISLFVLGNMESCDRELRHEYVMKIRRIGVKSIIGIYVKGSLPSGTKKEVRHAKRCINKLKNDPPTADGLDYLIVVSEEKEG